MGLIRYLRCHRTAIVRGYPLQRRWTRAAYLSYKYPFLDSFVVAPVAPLLYTCRRHLDDDILMGEDESPPGN